jgi:8-oxo-dGTP pyrophosphatase MutT (NUDIX family)
VTTSPRGAGDSIRELLDRYPVERPPTVSAGAAVTIVLRPGSVEPELLLIERTSDPDDPASGQVALPGGHTSERDGNLADTALRELEEEVGLTRADLAGEPRFVATLHARRFGLDVAVFAAELGPDPHVPSPRSVKEVAHVFWLPRSALDVTRRVERDTPAGPLPVSATVYEGHILWGFTRRVVRQFFGLPLEEEVLGPNFVPPARPSG